MSIKNMIWYESYRPDSISGMALQKNRAKMFQEYIDNKDCPHLLFFGSVGGGKTNVAKILISGIGCSALEMNSSSEDRGVETIKKTVSRFAGSKPLPGQRIKIAFFDEAEGLTKDAQMALKNLIETYSKTTRFIFTCNDVSKITEAIQSRCLGIHFERIPKRKVIEYCEGILEEEDIEYESDDLETLVDRIYPDMRSIVNYLQLCSIEGNLDITTERFLKIDPEEISELIIRGDLRAIREKISGIQNFKFLFNQLFDLFLDDYSGEAKVASDLGLCIIDGVAREAFFVADKEINFAGVCMELMGILDIKGIKF